MIKIGKHEIAEGRAYERVAIPGGGTLMVRGYPRDGVTIETRDEIATGYGDTFQAATDEAVRRVRGYVRDRLRTLRREANVEARVARAKADAKREIERLRKSEVREIAQIKRDAANAEKRIARVEKQAAIVKSWGAK